MNEDFLATASTVINAEKKDVWHALVDPDAIGQYMFGTRVESEWRPGEPITWKGEWNGKPYEDKGTIQAIDPESLLAYSHYSPMSGKPDVPENYHNVRITLDADGASTRVTLTQDGNSSAEAREHSQKNWEAMLAALKTFVEDAVR